MCFSAITLQLSASIYTESPHRIIYFTCTHLTHTRTPCTTSSTSIRARNIHLHARDHRAERRESIVGRRRDGSVRFSSVPVRTSFGSFCHEFARPPLSPQEDSRFSLSKHNPPPFYIIVGSLMVNIYIYNKHKESTHAVERYYIYLNPRDCGVCLRGWTQLSH